MENATTKVSIKIEGKEVEVGSQQHAKWLANNYFLADKVRDFSDIPTLVKLAVLQKTPKPFVKHRTIQGVQIPYIDHLFAQKALNFVFNFNVSTEIIGNIVFEESKDAKNRTTQECRLTIRFKFYDSGSQREIVRDVVAGHQAWENQATTKADCIKSAVSKSWTIVAKQFGIGADIHKKEEAAYGKFGLSPESDFVDVGDTQANETQPPAKTQRPKKAFETDTLVGEPATNPTQYNGTGDAPIITSQGSAREHARLSPIPSTPSF